MTRGTPDCEGDIFAMNSYRVAGLTKSNTSCLSGELRARSVRLIYRAVAPPTNSLSLGVIGYARCIGGIELAQVVGILGGFKV